MTTAELIALLRVKIEDDVSPHQFDDQDLILALNQAQDEFARVTLCVFDGTTAVTASAGTPWVTLPAGTVWIRGATFGGSDLRVVTQHELEYGYFSLNGTEANGQFSAWRSAEGTPKFLVSDLGPLIARLVPQPTSSASLVLERYRTGTPMTGSVDPEIPEAYHNVLLHGAAAFLYGTPGTEIFDAQKEMKEMGLWQGQLNAATIALQTGLRAQGRALQLPEGTYFRGAAVNTVGPNPNANTES